MWSDYFEPDFEDMDSPHYAGDGYLPIFDPHETIWTAAYTKPFFDIRDPEMVVRAVLGGTMSEWKHPRVTMTEYGRKILQMLEDDPEYDIFGPPATSDPAHYEPVPDEPYDPLTDERRFDRGKYKDQRVMDVAKRDPSYMAWAMDTILKHVR